MADKSAYVSLPLPSASAQSSNVGGNRQTTFAGQQFKPVHIGGGIQEGYCGGVMDDYFTPRAPANYQQTSQPMPAVSKPRTDQSCYLEPK